MNKIISPRIRIESTEKKGDVEITTIRYYKFKNHIKEFGIKETIKAIGEGKVC